MNVDKKDSSSLKLVFKELVWPFWSRSDVRWQARGLLLVTIALIFGMVYSLVLLNKWNQAFYDSIQRLDQAEFIHQLWRFFFIVLGYALAAAFKFFTLQSLALKWRTWMTEKNLNRWLQNKNFYQWQLTPQGNDNPDQRLSEDIFELSDLTLEIAEKIFREVITFVSFIGILWGLSTSLKFSAFGWNFELYRYLVVICLLYAVLGTWFVHRVGNPLASLHFFQQRFEADFRFLLVRLRENGEGIALSRGEPAEGKKLFGKFREIARNYFEVISRQRDVILTKNIYSQIAYIFPFVVSSGKVFTREITLGQLFQISSAFGQVQGSVSVFIELYPQIMRWYSVVIRLAGFLRALTLNETLQAGAQKNGTVEKSSPVVEAKDLALLTPLGRPLMSGVNFTLHAGDHLLLTANSGAGKSTLARTLMGLWPYYEGQLTSLAFASSPATTLPATMVLQQNPYFPIGTLKALLAYPQDAGAFEDAEFHSALELSDLSHLGEFLNVEDHWSQKLSSGERQRLALARVFLQKPSFLILDEATSALNLETTTSFYQNLKRVLPNTTILTLAPTNTPLSALHEKQLSF